MVGHGGPALYSSSASTKRIDIGSGGGENCRIMLRPKNDATTLRFVQDNSHYTDFTLNNGVFTLQGTISIYCNCVQLISGEGITQYRDLKPNERPENRTFTTDDDNNSEVNAF